MKHSFLLLIVMLRLIHPNMIKAQTAYQPVNNDTLKVYKDGEATNFFKRTEGVIAADGAISIPLSDGRVIWLFGDSFIDHYDSVSKTVPCIFQVRNSALLQPSNNWQWQQTKILLSKEPGAKGFLINKPDSTFIWPGCGFQLKDTVYIYCHTMKNVKEGLGFGKGGPPVFAKLKFPELNVVGFSELPDFYDVGFGNGFIVDSASGYVYAYGSKGKSLTGNLVLARFTINNPNTNWDVWNGKDWSKDASKSASVGKMKAVSLHITKIRNKYVAVGSDLSVGCDQGKNIYVSTSDKLTGPFKLMKKIYTLDDTVQGHYPFFYLPFAHSEFINEKDELLVTYSINGYGLCIEGCVKGRFNPEFYRIQAIRVPLKLLDEDVE